ncbi:hypothetical protein VTK56DRAFT_7874 [Thermocarpiscus australiensis]
MPEPPPPLSITRHEGRGPRAEATLLRSQRLGLGRGGSMVRLAGRLRVSRCASVSGRCVARLAGCLSKRLIEVGVGVHPGLGWSRLPGDSYATCRAVSKARYLGAPYAALSSSL